MLIAPRVDSYLQSVLRGDRRLALEIVDAALAGGLAIDVIQEDIVRESQRRIGALWERNVISVAEEHMATAITRQVLTHLHEGAIPAVVKDERVLVACVEGELHDMPARMVADVLELAGYDVRFLGANVPAQSLPGMLAQFRPDVLALSVTVAPNLRALATTIRLALEQLPSLLFAVGGRAVSVAGQLPQVKGAELCSARDARALANLLDRRFGHAPSFRDATRADA
ncbi:MAG: cobalamin-dependent protein [Steroidobacteraceae bacterium]|jgi:methanogenic corrinoid protein MtbC1